MIYFHDLGHELIETGSKLPDLVQEGPVPLLHFLLLALQHLQLLPHMLNKYRIDPSLLLLPLLHLLLNKRYFPVHRL